MMKKTRENNPGNFLMGGDGCRFFSRVMILLSLGFFFGCAPKTASLILFSDTAADSPALPGTQTLPPTRTAQPFSSTATTTSEATSTTTPAATNIPTTSAMRATPTRGLPPSLTPAPWEECPPPTNAKAEIRFSEKVAGYGPQILEYIRATGDKAGLEEQLENFGRTVEAAEETAGEKKMAFLSNSADIFEADVTGDPGKEFLIAVKQKSREMRYEMEVFVIGCRNRQYQMLSSDDGRFRFSNIDEELSRILAIRDLNADGIQDVVISTGYRYPSAQRDVFIDTVVLEWDGRDFRSLLFPGKEDPNSWGNTSFMDFPELKDMDGNGTVELLLPWYRDTSASCDGPQSPWFGVYMWDGEFFRYIWSDPGDPVYRFQAAFNGDYYTGIGLFDQSEAAYRRAILDSSLKPYYSQIWGEAHNRERCEAGPAEPGEPQRIIAYARLRLLELHAYLGDINAAESGAKFLADNYKPADPGYRYAVLGIQFWEAYKVRRSIDEACAAVRYESARIPEEVFDPLIYGGHSIQGPTLYTICPFCTDAGGEG